MKTYLVTGGAGFIGTNFVKYLLERWGDDINIIILDALTYAGNLRNLEQELQRDNVRFVRGDIGDSATVSDILAGTAVDYIVNFAAESHVDRSITNPRLFLETNILGTHNMLECARQARAAGKFTGKFLQISTDEVYGSLEKEYDEARPLAVDEALRDVITGRDGNPPVTYGTRMFNEYTPVSPRSPYSASKTAADLLVLAYHETYGLPVNITRCSNNYGPYHFPEKLIPLMINNTLHGKSLPVYGRGLNVRDWLYVTDHCRAIDLVLRHGRDGEVYNVGGFNEMSNIDIVKQIIAIIARIMRDEPQYQPLLHCPLDAVSEALITYVTDRPGHDMRYAIDPTKIATELGWYPATTFAAGIEKTVRWYLDHNDWLQEVTAGDYQAYYDRQYNVRR